MIRKTSSFLLLFLFLFIPLCAEVNFGFDPDPIDIVEQENIVVQFEDCSAFMVVNDRTVIEVMSLDYESYITVNIVTPTFAMADCPQIENELMEGCQASYMTGRVYSYPLLL